MPHCCFNLRKAALMVSLASSREAWKYHYNDTLPKIPRRLAAYSCFLSLKLFAWNVLKAITFFCGQLSKYLSTKTIIHKAVRLTNEVQTSHWVPQKCHLEVCTDKWHCSTLVQFLESASFHLLQSWGLGYSSSVVAMVFPKCYVCTFLVCKAQQGGRPAALEWGLATDWYASYLSSCLWPHFNQVDFYHVDFDLLTCDSAEAWPALVYISILSPLYMCKCILCFLTLVFESFCLVTHENILFWLTAEINIVCSLTIWPLNSQGCFTSIC